MRRGRVVITEPVYINSNACDGCGVCIEQCPKDVFEIRELTSEQVSRLSFFGKLKVRIKGRSKSYAATPQNCISCGICTRVCHERAITVKELQKRV